MRTFPQQIAVKIASRGSRSSTAGSSEATVPVVVGGLDAYPETVTVLDNDIEATLTSAIAGPLSTVLQARGG